MQHYFVCGSFIPILTVHFSASYIQLTYFKQDTYLKHTSKETCNIFFLCGGFIPILGDLEYILVLHTFIWHISDNIRICCLQVIKNSSVALSYASYIQQICFILQDGMFYGCISNNVLQTLGSFPLAHGDVIPWGFSPWMTRRMLACFCCWSSSSNISHAIWMKFIDDLARICRQNAVPILLIASTYFK
jgi:hypothetical protein